MSEPEGGTEIKAILLVLNLTTGEPTFQEFESLKACFEMRQNIKESHGLFELEDKFALRCMNPQTGNWYSPGVYGYE